MLLSIARRARGNPFILACLFVSFIVYYKPLHKFHLPKISKESQNRFNHTRQLSLSQNPDQFSIPRPEKEVPFSCPKPTCPPQPQCSPLLPPQLNETIAKSCICPSISLPISSSSATPSPLQSQPGGKPTKEQEIITKLRNEGIVIIFKTGAQEVSQLSIHLGTTLRWLSPNDILFFSDLQGSLGPFLIHDALRNVDEMLRDTNPDFEIYRKIHEYQSTGQDILELKEDRSRGDDRGGWKLDKYKFIHMVEETFEMRPDAKWYVFIETDSYIVWPNLVGWLSKLDSKKPLYMGSAVWTGAHSFAHGGSGYILSNAAMNKLLGPNQPQGLARSWDARMTSHCCGDIALGIALEEKGVRLTGARPFLNGYKPATFTYGEHWCQPVVAMHHLTGQEVSAMWRFERKREVMGIENVTTFSELYEQFVEPHLMEERDNWDNLSHGQEFKEPEGWSLSAEEEQLRREEEERIKVLADELKQQRLEEEKKNKDNEEGESREEERKDKDNGEGESKDEEKKDKDNEEGESRDEEKGNEDAKSSDDGERSNEEKLKQANEAQMNKDLLKQFSEEQLKSLKEELQKPSSERKWKSHGGNIGEDEWSEEQMLHLIEEVEKERLDPEARENDSKEVKDSEEKEGSKEQKDGEEDRDSEEKKSKEREKAKEREMNLRGKGKGKKKQEGQEDVETKDDRIETKIDDEGGTEKPLVASSRNDAIEEKEKNDRGENDDTRKDDKADDLKVESDETGASDQDGSKEDADKKSGEEAPEDEKKETSDTESQHGSDDSNAERESSKSDDLPESESTQKSEGEIEPTSATPLKRLLKRQDSLADADPSLNTHTKWRPFSPEREAFKSFSNCRQACAAAEDCFQFVHYERTCKLSTSFRLGAYKAPEIDLGGDGQVIRNVTFKSGWMMERIRKWTEGNACKEVEWPVVAT